MKIKLNENDIKKLNELRTTRILNEEVLAMLSNYLVYRKCNVKRKSMNEFLEEYHLGFEQTYLILLSVALDLDTESSYKDERIHNEYLVPSVRKMNLIDYIDNPYYKNIKLNNIKYDSREYKEEKYMPYEAFIYNDFIVDKTFKEVPRLGFFNCEFEFPAVLENGNEWMTITPNEINTMKESINKAHGKVLTFGLGLGYYQYMVSLKDDVESVTIVEKDARVIKLFKENILPQFTNSNKIHIIESDAFEYMEQDFTYDYVFADLWHDVSDGFSMYMKFKKLENLHKGIKFTYWIEESLLSVLRRYVWNSLYKYTGFKTKSSIYDLDGIGTNRDEYIDLISKIDEYYIDTEINSYDDFAYLLTNESLRKLAKSI